MARSRHEKETSRFDCSAVGRVVRVTHEYILLDNRGRIEARQFYGFECDGYQTCPVAHKTGPHTMSFDWKKCVHPTMVASQRNR